MTLSKDVYRELEDIVGPENISEDPVVLEGYSRFPIGLDPRGVTNGFTMFSPEAVVLPGSAKDVQAIVRLCHRRGIKCKAHSTGYGAMNQVSGEGMILLDMRRMNRIIDIDEKNMVVIVEPYVTFAQVQAEAMKKGVNCHVIGAGSNASYLASMSSVVGNNTQAMTQGYSGRNLLGVEWVLPTGEMIRLGAPGSGAGWFSGDGPGPSLRGIMRGAAGATGGLGVFTKLAGHLHPWSGPREMEINGVSPYYEAELPPLFEYHILEWPTWEQCSDALYKLGEAGIIFAMHKTGGPGSHGSCVTGNNNEYYAMRQAGEMDLPEVSWSVVTAAYTEAEHAYQVKVLNSILEDTGGKICPTGEVPLWKKRDFITMIKACFIPRLAFRLTGNFACDGMMAQETPDHCAYALKMDRSLRDKYVEKGAIMDDGTCNNWGVIYEGGHWGVLEGGYLFHPQREESVKGMAEMMFEGIDTCLKTPLAISWTVFGEQMVQLGPQMYNPHLWMRKIKKAFDPYNVSDPMGYIPPEE